MPRLNPERAMYLNGKMLQYESKWNYISVGDDFDVIAEFVFHRIYCYLYEHTYPSGEKGVFFTAYEGIKPRSHELRNYFEREIKQNEP
jgi:hypothetical protein